MVKATKNVQVKLQTTGSTRRGRRRAARAASGVSSRRRRNLSRRTAVTVTLPRSNGNSNRRGRRNTALNRRVRNIVNSAMRSRGVLGPKPAISQSATATLGTVGANQGQDVELEGAFMLNPALTKETTGSNQFGPVQVAAATYNMWKLRRATVRLTPLVGNSAVSGTAIRVSLNLSGSPSSSSWSALGARKHVDTSPGRFVQFNITERELPGPKEGWFMTSTKGVAEMAIGGSVEIHTLGKTMSTYKNEPYNGPLFLVELHATWQFANYSPNPGMLNLVRGTAQETAQNVTVESTPGEPIRIVTPPTSAVTRATGGRIYSPNRAGLTPTVQEIIWQIVDTTVDTVAEAFPPPFNWLFKGGWWFMKRVIGTDATREAAGSAVFYVYQSITDARNNNPCRATAAAKTTLTARTWEYSQITPGNVGLATQTADVLDAGVVTDPIDPIDPPTGPTDPTDPTTPVDPPTTPVVPEKPEIDITKPISYVGSYVDEFGLLPGSTTPDFGCSTLLWRQQKTTGGATGWNAQCTQPDSAPCVRFSKGNNNYPLVPNACIMFGTGLDDPLHTQIDAWLQDSEGYVVETHDPAEFHESNINVYASSTDQQTILGRVCLGQTFLRRDGLIGCTTLVFKARIAHQAKVTVASDVPTILGIVKRGIDPEKTSGASTENPVLLVEGSSYGNGLTLNFPIVQDQYYGLVYIFSALDPAVSFDDVTVPLSLNYIVRGNAGGGTNQAVVLAYPNKGATNTGIGGNHPNGALMFSPVGMLTGAAMPFWYVSGTNPTWNNVTIPADYPDEQPGPVNDPLIQSLVSGFQHLGNGEDGSRGATAAAPTALAAARTSGSEPNQDAGNEADDSDDDSDSDESITGPPLTCDCRWGGHPDCPYPHRDENWGDPPEDLCEVDGKQIGLLNLMIKSGMKPVKAKRALCTAFEGTPARIFQDLYEAHLYSGLCTNTSRSLAYCHALRAQQGFDPYGSDDDSETGEDSPAKDSKL